MVARQRLVGNSIKSSHDGSEAKNGGETRGGEAVVEELKEVTLQGLELALLPAFMAKGAATTVQGSV